MLTVTTFALSKMESAKPTRDSADEDELIYSGDEEWNNSLVRLCCMIIFLSEILFSIASGLSILFCRHLAPQRFKFGDDSLEDNVCI